MNRRDAYLDAMLRHLGAAYYDSLHGRAVRADVVRAVESVAEHLGEKPVSHPAVARPAPAGHHGSGTRRELHGRWHSRVRDVMTTSVVTADRITPYKEIAGLLAEHQISGLPVLAMGRHVAGVVSEGDLLAARDHNPMAHRRPRWLGGGTPHQRRTAEQLMTSPAITTHPDATIAAAARLMNAHHVKRLPVVDPDGKLIGIVSRRDLLSVFLRPDSEIARQVGEILAEVLPEEPAAIKVAVRNGIVSLTGQFESHDDQDLLPVAVRLIWDVDGLVDVLDRTGTGPVGTVGTVPAAAVPAFGAAPRGR